MKFTRTAVILGVIILVACFFRLWKLGDVPPSLNWDEVALGYNAYSLMQTSKDEYGKVLPFVLRSYDDYKPGLYSYFVIPSILLFDLTPFAVRFPSAFFGILAIFATYFLAKELFVGKKYAAYYGLLASFLLAISPWHVQFSRQAFESNVAVAFNIFFVLFFLKGLKKPIFLPLSALLMALNLYMYQSAKVFVPLLALSLFIIFRKELFRIQKKYLFVAVIVGLVLVLPMAHYILTSKEALARAQGVSVFSDTTPLLKENAQRLIVDRQGNDYIGLVLDNRRVFYVKTVLAGYLSHFDFNWLFITGDIARHHAPFMGLLYLVELPFLFFGMYILLFDDHIPRKAKILIFTWFLITPIPASITSGVPHAVRTLNFLPIFQIFTALGLITVFIKLVKFRYIIIVCFLALASLNFLYYLDQYFMQQNYYSSQEWQYGYEEAVDAVKKIEGNYEKIVVSNKPHLDQSYMFFLFFLRYPPALYQKDTTLSGGFRENHAFGKYEFRPIDWNEEKSKNTLYVGRPGDFGNDARVIKEINFIDGKPAIKIVE